MLLERAWRVVKEPVLLMVGVHRAPVDSELAENDFRGLLRKAKNHVRYAAEQIPEREFDLLVGLVDRGVKLELIVGKTQDPMLLARLQSKGADMVDIWKSEQGIPSPFVIVDDTHIMRCDMKDETKPRIQFVIFKNDFIAEITNSSFRKLLRLSKK